MVNVRITVMACPDLEHKSLLVAQVRFQSRAIASFVPGGVSYGIR